jgi:predicted small lipoprotein YifL
MRASVIAIAAAILSLAACGQPKPEAPGSAEVTEPAPAPEARFAPMSAERTALCATALEAFKGLGTTKPPGAMTVADYAERAPLLGLRGMEIELVDREAFKTARDAADAAWKDKTPADIEAATVACLNEIKG